MNDTNRKEICRNHQHTGNTNKSLWAPLTIMDPNSAKTKKRRWTQGSNNQMKRLVRTAEKKKKIAHNRV
jgi:hypothetical protein